MSERKFTYDFLLGLANHYGLILERENKTIDGVRYRYTVCSNSKGIVDFCRNLDEAYQSIWDLR